MIITEVFNLPVREVFNLVDSSGSIDIRGLVVCTSKVRKKLNTYGVYCVRVDGFQNVYSQLMFSFFSPDFIITVIFEKGTQKVLQLKLENSVKRENGIVILDEYMADFNKITLSDILRMYDNVSTV